MILYIQNPEDSIRKLLELVSELSKVAGHKINTQKSLGFLYINNEIQKEKLRNQSHSPLQKKEIKYLEDITYLRRQKNCTQKNLRH